MRTAVKTAAMATLGVMALGLSSCASIFTHSTYPVEFNSLPQGANVTVENRDGRTVYNGQTPATLWLQASAGYMRPEIYRVTYRQKGQEPVTTYIEAKIDGWYFGNLLFGGFVGMLLVDPLTGAMWRIPAGSEVVSVTMENSPAMSSESIGTPQQTAQPQQPADQWSQLGEK